MQGSAILDATDRSRTMPSFLRSSGTSPIPTEIASRGERKLCSLP